MMNTKTHAYDVEHAVLRNLTRAEWSDLELHPPRPSRRANIWRDEAAERPAWEAVVEKLRCSLRELVARGKLHYVT